MFTLHWSFGTLHSRYLNFVLFLCFCGTQMAPNSLTLRRPEFIVSDMFTLISLFSRLVDGFSCLVVRGQGMLPASCITSHTIVNLNYGYEDFEPQGAKMIKLFGLVRSRIQKNSFFVHFQACFVMEEEVVMQSVFSTYPVHLLWSCTITCFTAF